MQWGKWLMIGAVVYGAWAGLRPDSGAGTVERRSYSESELTDLAAATRPQDVLIYTLTSCPYCAQAKSWLERYGFRYTECDAQVSSACAAQLQDLETDGVPYLIVRGHHMKEGFDSDEFIAALQQ